MGKKGIVIADGTPSLDHPTEELFTILESDESMKYSIRAIYNHCGVRCEGSKRFVADHSLNLPLESMCLFSLVFPPFLEGASIDNEEDELEVNLDEHRNNSIIESDTLGKMRRVIQVCMQASTMF